MSVNYNFFIFETVVPIVLTKGAIYITSYGEDYVNIFRSIGQYEKNIGKIEETDENKNIFVDRGVYTSSVDFRIKNPYLPRESIFIQSSKSVMNIIQNIKANNITSYDIFSGKNIQNLQENEIEDIQKNIKIFYYVMMQYMSAGYHKRENKRKIPDWCLCFGEPIMKYFIEYFDIRTEAPDINIVDQFLTNPQFREMITVQMMKFMANYIINNNIINPTDVNDWYDMKMWLTVKNKI